MKFYTFLIIIIMIVACNNNQEVEKEAKQTEPEYKAGSFGFDIRFLQQQDTNLLLLGKGDARIAVSAKFQGKVFTSTTAGMDGRSLGWINYKAFGQQDQHMNPYGGEDRLWLGPEGGPFSLFFKKGDKMEFEKWKTPAGFDTEPWTLQTNSDTSTIISKDLSLMNYAGTALDIGINRKIIWLDEPAIASLLNGIQLPEVNAVGYSTENTLSNKGNKAWTKESGAPCIWMLDMFPPSDQTTIVIPYNNKNNRPPANTDYFGKIPDDRIRYQNSVLYFKADGKQRGKLGLVPENARSVAGSYDAANRVLTIILFDVSPAGTYLDQQWRTDLPPFKGDAVNAYNDGPLADGSQMGPFYELESVSPALFLNPGQSVTHRHSVFHFTGNENQLDTITNHLLGTSIQKIKTVFQ